MNRRLSEAIERSTERAHRTIATQIRRHGWWVKRPTDDEPVLVRVFDAQDASEMRKLYPNAEVTPE